MILVIFIILGLIFIYFAVSGGAISPLQEAAERALQCGCVTWKIEGDVRVEVIPLSKAWLEGDKKCRMIRAMVWEKGSLRYNGVQRICEY